MSIVMFPRRVDKEEEARVAARVAERVELVARPRQEPVVRRPASQEQGRALEALGHAVEYLVDSRMFLGDERSLEDDQEAVQILMRLSRTVFSECPEVLSLKKRLSRWVHGRAVGEAPAR